MQTVITNRKITFLPVIISNHLLPISLPVRMLKKHCFWVHIAIISIPRVHRSTKRRERLYDAMDAYDELNAGFPVGEYSDKALAIKNDILKALNN